MSGTAAPARGLPTRAQSSALPVSPRTASVTNSSPASSNGTNQLPGQRALPHAKSASVSQVAPGTPPVAPLRRESTLATTGRTVSPGPNPATISTNPFSTNPTTISTNPFSTHPPPATVSANPFSTNPPTNPFSSVLSPTPISPRISSVVQTGLSQSHPALPTRTNSTPPPSTTSRPTTTRGVLNRVPSGDSNPPSPGLTPTSSSSHLPHVATPPVLRVHSNTENPTPPARVAPISQPTRTVARTPTVSEFAPIPENPTSTTRGAPAPGTRTIARKPTVSELSSSNGGARPISRALVRQRRVSKVIVDKEKKTDYWQEVIQEAKIDAPELSQEDINAMIARCLSLELVANWKHREQQGDAPKAKELFQQLAQRMEERLAQLNGGPVPIEGTGFARIRNMEQQLQNFEAQSEKDQENEAEKVKAKISELTSSLGALQRKKDQERESHRRTMTMEINNLREQMLKAASDPQKDQQALFEQNKALAAKVAGLEASLKSINEEKKGEDNESFLLKRKLALFEAKMKQLEEDKKLREAEDSHSGMRDKLVLMEEKLAKMERRKSVSITMMMQEKMQQVEQQLTTLRSVGLASDSDKIAQLEKKLVELQTTKVIPSMINDPETRALRSHVKKMEDALLAAEQKMEAERVRMEEERHLQAQKRQREEESYRNKVQQREQMLLAKMAEMEKRIGTTSSKGTSNPLDQTMQKKLEELEKRMVNGGAFADRMAEMETRLKETEERLMKERQTSQMLMGVLGSKEGPELDAAEKDLKIALLTATTEELMKRLEATAKAMDDKFAGLSHKIETMKFSSGPATQVHKSGLTYDEINAKLAEIQARLFDPNIEERESEQLNIDYEKLISELETTPEYKAEQEAILQKWSKENGPLNKAAYERVMVEVASWSHTKKTSQYKKKPELKLLEFTQEQLLKKMSNDYRSLTTQNLSLDEARALFHHMPPFRKDQEAQLQWIEQLKQRIETEAKKPVVKPPPPIKAKKAVVMKKPSKSEGGGDFLGELLRKRKQVG